MKNKKKKIVLPLLGIAKVLLVLAFCLGIIAFVALNFMYNDKFSLVKHKFSTMFGWKVSAYSVMVDGNEIGKVEYNLTAQNAWDNALKQVNSGSSQYYIETAYTAAKIKTTVDTFCSEEELESQFCSILEERISEYSYEGLSVNVGDNVFIFPTIEEIKEFFTLVGQKCLGSDYIVSCTDIVDYKPQYEVKLASTGELLTYIEQDKLKDSMTGLKNSTTAQIISEQTMGVYVDAQCEVQPIYVRNSDLSNAEEAAAQCLIETQVTADYTTRSGETLTTVAQKFNMTLSELLSLNKGYTKRSKLSGGEVLKVTTTKKVVEIYTEVRTVYTRYEDPPIIYVYDPDQYTYYSSVQYEGKQSYVIVEDVVRYDGGIEQNREEITKVTITAAVDKIVVVGTKQLPDLIWPTTGGITSVFGKSAGYIWGNHSGIDIGNKKNTKVYAAYAGYVTKATYADDYGNHIYIKNGELTFVYGHFNKMVVKRGDYVEQGDLLGYMGSTGLSTGPHLHFEMRYQGVRVDPLLFLPTDYENWGIY